MLAEQQGEPERALAYLRRLRWRLPNELWPCLRFAEVAQGLNDFPGAMESLRWAMLRHAKDPAPYVALGRLHLDQKDLAAARSVADRLEELVGPEADEALGLREAINSASATPR
jgi:hypothetical protein